MDETKFHCKCGKPQCLESQMKALEMYKNKLVELKAANAPKKDIALTECRLLLVRNLLPVGHADELVDRTTIDPNAEPDVLYASVQFASSVMDDLQKTKHQLSLVTSMMLQVALAANQSKQDDDDESTDDEAEVVN